MTIHQAYKSSLAPESTMLHAQHISDTDAAAAAAAAARPKAQARQTARASHTVGALEVSTSSMCH